MNWFQSNFKKIIYVSFLVPILTVAFVSISHVTKWYGISNPLSWAVYLSIGVEIAALSALAAISAQMGRKVYLPFGIVTLIQFIGNIFFAYQYIDINNQSFKDWVDLVDPLVSYMGVESGNLIGHKRFLAFFAGGMLPLISLSFLHMLVKFEEEEKKLQNFTPIPVDLNEISKQAGKIEAENIPQKWTPTENELKILENILEKKQLNVENKIQPESPEVSKVNTEVDDIEISQKPETEKILIKDSENETQVEIPQTKKLIYTK